MPTIDPPPFPSFVLPFFASCNLIILASFLFDLGDAKLEDPQRDLVGLGVDQSREGSITINSRRYSTRLSLLPQRPKMLSTTRILSQLSEYTTPTLNPLPRDPERIASLARQLDQRGWTNQTGETAQRALSLSLSLSCVLLRN